MERMVIALLLLGSFKFIPLMSTILQVSVSTSHGNRYWPQISVA
jgi:hypothetical protein